MGISFMGIFVSHLSNYDPYPTRPNYSKKNNKTRTECSRHSRILIYNNTAKVLRESYAGVEGEGERLRGRSVNAGKLILIRGNKLYIVFTIGFNTFTS